MPVGRPLFRTSKTLAGRALVADAFDRRPQSATDTVPGLGNDAHREGYNVLYGDGSASWYGDPDKRIMYLIPTYDAWGYGASWPQIGSLDSDGLDMPSAMGSHMGFITWHRFDVAHGEDAAVVWPGN